MKTEIIFEDKDLLVVRKPAGLATQTARVGQADVVSELKNYMAVSGTAKPPYLGIIHRLDQPVEGLLVFAKNQRVAAELTRQLNRQDAALTKRLNQQDSELIQQLNRQDAEPSLNKQYYAVICGKPSRKEGCLVDYLYRDARKAVIAHDHTECPGDSREKAAKSREDSRGISEDAAESRDGATPKKAVLQYKILRTLRTSSDEEISLTDIHIETGRFHQIRAQMAHAGMGLLGDEKYADEAVRACSRRLGIRTVALCAVSLAFVHPVTGERMSFEVKPASKAFSFFEL